MNQEHPDVTVLIPVTERHDDLRQLYYLYSEKLKGMKKNFEFLFVLDGDFSAAHDSLEMLKKEGGRRNTHPTFPKKFRGVYRLDGGFSTGKR